jgi:glycosyltransferase involved in cell wall biosynthesis
VNRFGVLLATRRYWPLPGGWESVWMRLLGALVERGHTATVLTPAWQFDWPSETLQTGVRIMRLPPPMGGGWEEYRYLRRLTRALRQLRGTYDAVIASGMRGDAYAALGEARREKFPVLLVPEQPGLRGDCHWQIESRCGPRVKRRCYRADAFVAATPLIEREVIAAGYARSRIHQVPLGVPLPTPTTPAMRLEARRSLAQADPALRLEAEAPLVVYAGRLRLGKGLDVLLEAWHAFEKRAPKAHLWLVGEGADARPLRERIFELGINAGVRLTGAFDDVDDVYRAADVVVCPALEDGPAVGLCEAAAYGLPIVASDVLTHRQLFDDGAECFIYPRRDAAALAAALERAFEPSGAGTLGAAARRRVERDYALPRMADAFEKLIAETLATRAARAAR